MDDNSGRLTDTYENAGSRDWMPGWAMGMRLEDVKPTFDIFSLGKVLWSMISGKSKLRLWYLHEPEFEIERMFPEDRSILWARELLDSCIVEKEDKCIDSAPNLLHRVDKYIQVLRLPHSFPGTCTERAICGMGKYTESVREDRSTNSSM